MKNPRSLIRSLWSATPLIAGAVLIVAACGKFLAPEAFAEAMAAHGIVPPRVQGAFTVGVPLAELWFGASALWLLAYHSDPRAASRRLLVAYAALLVYTVVLWINPPAQASSCGCGFSAAPVESWGMHAGANFLMAGLLAGCMVRGRASRRTPEPVASPT